MAQTAFIPVFLQRVVNLSPAQTGFAMLFVMIPGTLMAPVAGRLFDRYGNKPAATLGMGLLFGGFFLGAFVLPYCEFLWIIPAMILCGLGLGLAPMQTYTDGISRVSSKDRVQAFGMLDTVRQMGGAMGIAAIVSFVTVQEHTQITSLSSQVAPTRQDRSLLDGVLMAATQAQPTALHEVLRRCPSLASELKLWSAKSIAGGYAIGAAMAAIGFLCALLLMRRRVPADPS